MFGHISLKIASKNLASFFKCMYSCRLFPCATINTVRNKVVTFGVFTGTKKTLRENTSVAHRQVTHGTFQDVTHGADPQRFTLVDFHGSYISSPYGLSMGTKKKECQNYMKNQGQLHHATPKHRVKHHPPKKKKTLPPRGPHLPQPRAQRAPKGFGPQRNEARLAVVVAKLMDAWRHQVRQFTWDVSEPKKPVGCWPQKWERF